MDHTANPPFPETGTPPTRLPFDERGIQLWKATLAQPDDALAVFLPWLNENEALRAEKRATPTLQRYAISARAQLRWLLARELNCAPQAIEFTEGEHGRPMLKHKNHKVRDFNLSHSGNAMLIGMVSEEARFTRIGVDLESKHKPRDIAKLAQRVLTEREQATLNDANNHERFLRYWTLKEAFSKADGRGFSLGFGSLEFSFSENTDASKIKAARLPAPENPEQWYFAFVPFSEDMIAAVALG